MLDIPFLIRHGLKYGFLFSLLFSALLLVMARINPEMLLNDYPPDIKARYGPMKAGTRKQARPFVFLFLLILLGTLVAMLAHLALLLGGQPSSPAVFIVVFTAMFTFNLVDLFVLDWLVFNTLRPKFVILPGTEGMAGYKDYLFHFRGFLIGTLVCIVVALLTTGLVYLYYYFAYWLLYSNGL